MTVMSPGQLVRQAREAQGLSRDRLAYSLGTSVSTIVRFELEDRLPKARMVAAIAKALDIPVSDLLDAAPESESVA